MYWVRIQDIKGHTKGNAIYRIGAVNFASPLIPGEVRTIQTNGEWRDLFSLTPEPLEAILRPEEVKETPLPKGRREALINASKIIGKNRK